MVHYPESARSAMLTIFLDVILVKFYAADCVLSMDEGNFSNAVSFSEPDSTPRLIPHEPDGLSP
jgi:hypothetical protein